MDKRPKSKILDSSSKTKGRAFNSPAEASSNESQTKGLIKKITQKKEFSQLPKKDVELAFEKFDKDKYLDEEKVKLTRDLLRKVYSSFTSQKLLGIKDRDVKWVLNKHKSTKERLPYYDEVYARILNGLGTQGCTPKNIQENIFTKGKISVIDLGAGVNGFSYEYFKSRKINYVGVEAVGQLVELMNYFFKSKKIKARAFHLSLFEIDKVKELIKKQKKPRVVFLFKVIDSLEVLERNYSKKLLEEIAPLVDKVVLSFATHSLGKRAKFKVKRNWIIDFIKDNFFILDEFELGGEKYVVFQKK